MVIHQLFFLQRILSCCGGGSGYERKKRWKLMHWLLLCLNCERTPNENSQHENNTISSYSYFCAYLLLRELHCTRYISMMEHVEQENVVEVLSLFYSTHFLHALMCTTSNGTVWRFAFKKKEERKKVK